jgi:hypothetical protein
VDEIIQPHRETPEGLYVSRRKYGHLERERKQRERSE